ncbi:MAG: type II CRISPR RNA-guided endonuclease Cas9 [Methylobacter sp.]|uniref:type II CRISPR RNA-guided endonuclease Cas9 n=1 Tax=Methylobacter sp. TaxID=2051955 RepID=UPI00258D8DA5|nr:type II CRISPR RNA-guided endonuclease Cas9 [Methylobacter sp.]MCL7423214.1 type II CRISPR RNA-guided endonuclease Cas9 [Methylobacter sp.]
MSKKVLGLDLGTYSIGWALLEENRGRPDRIIDLGCRVFNEADGEKTPAPGNPKRSDAKLNRRILQRKAKRKQRMLNYLLKLNWLPEELQASPQPEIILNRIGDPYRLRAKALDEKLSAHELGRVLLHFVQCRGFSGSRETWPGAMIDDPDVLAVLAESEEGADQRERDSGQAAFKQEAEALRTAIKEAGCRTLGEYLASRDHPDCKRIRAKNGEHLRTDRQMYKDELGLIWRQQRRHHERLTEPVKERIERIIFYQRPVKPCADRIGRCPLEPKRRRAGLARLESQRFRYLQAISNLTYLNHRTETEERLSAGQIGRLSALCETEANISFARIKELLGFDNSQEFNLERDNKKLNGNVTAWEIRKIFSGWDNLGTGKQQALVEDLLTINKKSVLRKRLLGHWGLDSATAVKLCQLSLEPGYSPLSSKAINKLLPFLYQGQSVTEARVSAGYGPEVQAVAQKDKLAVPPETANPVLQNGLHELRRLINALVAEYGKPDAIRVQMARELKMNSRRYAAFGRQQKARDRMNEKAVLMFQRVKRQNPHLALTDAPGKSDQLRYRLWQDQRRLCAYSGQRIAPSALFGPEVEIDHILPYSESLDDSYMNKALCFVKEKSVKGRKTPIEAFGGNEAQWHQIEQNLKRWDRCLASKQKRFFMTAATMRKADFIGSQLNDARRISRVVHDYLQQLDAAVTVSTGRATAWLRRQWDLNGLLGETPATDRGDYRQHAIDALATACIDRRFFTKLSEAARELERKQSELNIDDLRVDPAWRALREDLRRALDKMIVAHVPRLKLSGEGHELAGAESAEDGRVHHKDGKPPVKRVRIWPSETGPASSNIHYVEILRHKTTGQYSGEFVTRREAGRRAKGAGKHKPPVIKTDHSEPFEFVMALHVNDTVSVEQTGQRVFYRVQKLDAGSNRCLLRLHSTALPDRKTEEIDFSINAASFNRWRLQKHKINAIGKLIDDKPSGRDTS